MRRMPPANSDFLSFLTVSDVPVRHSTIGRFLVRVIQASVNQVWYELPGLVIQWLRRCLWIVVGDVSQTARRNPPAIVVLLSHMWCERYSHWHSVSLSSIQLTISLIKVIWLVSIGNVILANWRTPLTAATGWNHPAKQVIGKSRVLFTETQRLSSPPVMAGTT